MKLIGSEKQVKWASDITKSLQEKIDFALNNREEKKQALIDDGFPIDKADKINEMFANLEKFNNLEVNAGWAIDNRVMFVSEFSIPVTQIKELCDGNEIKMNFLELIDSE